MFIFFSSNIRMSGKNINFHEKEISKSNFYRNIKLFNIDDIDIDINTWLISKKEPYDTKSLFKYFIGYSDNNNIKTLCIKLLQMMGMLSVLIVIRQCL